MKRFLLALLLMFVAFVVKAQDSTTIWLSIGANGNIYALDLSGCNTRLICTTNHLLGDIAFTPNGKFWGTTGNNLFRIDTTTGNTILIGAIPPSNSLVGLNDSILLVESSKDLYAIKTTDASAHLIGHIGYSGDGDLTWLGRNLYMFGEGYLIRIKLNNNYSEIISVDTLRDESNPYNYSTAAIATAYIDNLSYKIVAIPVNDSIYSLDSMNAAYHVLCTLSAPVLAYGASSFIFPADSIPLSTRIPKIQAIELMVYPIPANNTLFLDLLNFKGKISEVELLFYDNIGRLLVRRKLQSNKEKIDISNYNHGLYLLKLQYLANDIATQKVIK